MKQITNPIVIENNEKPFVLIGGLNVLEDLDLALKTCEETKPHQSPLSVTQRAAPVPMPGFFIDIVTFGEVIGTETRGY